MKPFSKTPVILLESWLELENGSEPFIWPNEVFLEYIQKEPRIIAGMPEWFERHIVSDLGGKHVEGLRVVQVRKRHLDEASVGLIPGIDEHIMRAVEQTYMRFLKTLQSPEKEEDA
jgi:hypothetical protein